MTPEKLIKEWKDSLETKKIQLDNLDLARLVFNENGEVVVENEHCEQFPVSDLSEAEIELFFSII